METDKKEGRKIITVSLHDEDIALLNKIAGEVGVNKSELIRRMLYKFSFDDKGKAILKAGHITSHNVHYDNKIKCPTEPRSGADSSSLEPTNNIPQNTETHNIESTLKEWRDLFHGNLSAATYNQCPSAFLTRIEEELMLRYKIYKRDVDREIGYEDFRKNWRALSEAWQRNIQETIEIAKAPWVDQ